MPEGDILRRTAATLNRALAGRILRHAELRWPSVASIDLTGRRVVETVAYGKHLFTRFDDDRTLHSHLRMEGVWSVRPTASPPSSATVRALLVTEAWTAIGDRLGMLDVVPTVAEWSLIGHLGPDLLADDFPTDGLVAALERYGSHGGTPVAEVLLDQTVVAGIGTIYAAESLFLRRIWPWTPADRVDDPASLLMAARAIMVRSVTAPTPTATGDTARGRTTRVHGRARLPCPRCGTPVRVGQARTPPRQRPVFYCPVCQAAPNSR